MNYWYISFADDSGFLGATVVWASSPDGALRTATNRGLNPGGDAAIWPVPDGVIPKLEKMINILMGKAEMHSLGHRPLKEMDKNSRKLVESLVTIVCEDCNRP